MKFSVIIPCYNVEKYIENTIKTVLNQTYKDFEIILIDDGSKDSTLAILNNLKETDNRIKIFTQPNKGVSYTRNRGIDIAKGEYIYFLDADDEIKNTLFEEANKVFSKKNIGVFSFGYKVIKETKEKIYIANKEFEGVYTSKEFLKKSKMTNLEKYGIEWFCSTKKAAEARNNTITQIRNTTINMFFDSKKRLFKKYKI